MSEVDDEIHWCNGTSGGSEIILIIFIILLLFGAKKLPDLARSMGKSLGEFKKGQQRK